MTFGLGVLRLAPDQFWRMTPREVAIIGGTLTRHAAPIDRAAFAHLMTRYPDGGHT